MSKRVETITYKGIRFRRYPDAKQHSGRRYFTPGIADRQRGTQLLHREVWMDANGVTEIPEGCHIHHRDHDADNNDPSNLELLTAEEHREHHSEDRRGQPPTREQEAHLAHIRPLAAVWHGSEPGRAWHSEHGEQTWADRPYRREQCDQCGAVYESRMAQQADRFCSNACKSAWRRASGVDDEDRDCGLCGKTFRVNKYSKTTGCSRSCGKRLSIATRAGL